MSNVLYRRGVEWGFRAGVVALLLMLSAAGQMPPVGNASADVQRERMTSEAFAWARGVRVGDRVRAALFDDVVLAIDVTQVAMRPWGDVVWHGKIAGEQRGTCTVTIQGGVVCGGFWSERGSYGIVPMGTRDGSGRLVSAVQLLSPDATRRCLMAEGVPSVRPGHEAGVEAGRGPELDVAVDVSGGREHPARSPVHGGRAGGGGDGGSAPDARSCGCPDDQSIVDVLCVYTTLAKNAAGGVAAIQARVQNAVDATNGAYTNSQINTSGVNRLQVRIAGYSEVAYNEVAPDWLDHLVRVTEPADGIMDNVHALRDQFKADTVMLVVDDARFTGGAAWWAIWDEGQAFSTCNWRGLGGGSLLLAHELGHNFGCAHDYENDASAPTSYARGYSFTSGPDTYRTIMSYPGNVDLQYFSNPYLTHGGTGQPMGVHVGQPRAAYDAYMIQQTRWVLANYRDAARITDCNANGVDDAVDISSGASQDANADCRPDECEERRYADAQTPGPGEGRTWANGGGYLRELMDVAGLKCSNIKSIWIADGTYTPASAPDDRYGSFSMVSGLKLYGGFQGKSRAGGGETSLSERVGHQYLSILSGEIGLATMDDNSYSVVTAYGADSHSLLDRFTIERGSSPWWGGGAYLEGASTRFNDCIVRDNVTGAGGGIAAWTGGSPTYSDCVFENNVANNGGGGGVSGNDGVSLTLSRCVIRGNSGLWGGGVAVANASAAVEGCQVLENDATAYNGGGMDIHNTQLSLVDSLIAHNHATSDAGGVWTASGSVCEVINCTIAENHADTWTGGLVAYFDTADVINSVFWGNTGIYEDVRDQQLLYYGSTESATYTITEGGAFGGVGNSSADPYFTDSGAGDFSLSFGSACIDAGNTAAHPAALVLDAVGNPRVADDLATADTGPGSPPVIDIGAVERRPCEADFDHSGFVDLDDFVAFVGAFDAGTDDADFDGSGFVDTDDFDAFVHAFEAGC